MTNRFNKSRQSELVSLADRAGTSVGGATSLDEVLTRGGLAWGVEKAQCYSPEGDAIDNLYMLRRDDTHQVLNVVRGRYSPVDNRDMFEPFDKLVREFGATYENAGVTHGGGTCWISARLPDEYQVRDGDVMQSRIVALANHDGIRTNSFLSFANRVLCNNMMGGLTAAGKRQGHQVRHVGDAQQALAQASQSFQDAITGTIQFQKTAETLVRRRMSRNQAERFLSQFVPDATPRAGEREVTERQRARVETRRNHIMTLFQEGAGNVGETRWDMLNAVTEYFDHHAFKSNKNASRAFVRDAGGLNTHKQVALELLAA